MLYLYQSLLSKLFQQVTEIVVHTLVWVWGGVRAAGQCMCSYKRLPVDMMAGSQILCEDGSIVMEVISTDPKAGTAKVKCLNSATLWCVPKALELSCPFL